MTHTTKHTPGPWTVSAGRTIETPSGQFYLTYNMDKHGNPLFRSFVELDSNAALIAAAPAMYEALCGLLEYYGAYNPVTDKRIEPYIREAKAALAQAEDKP